MSMGKDGFPIFPSGLSPTMAAKVRALRAEFDGAKQMKHSNTESKRALMSRQATKDAALEKYNKATEDIKKITTDATRLYNEITADVIFPDTSDVPLAEPSHVPSDVPLAAPSNEPGVSDKHIHLSRDELQQIMCCATTAATMAVHNSMAMQRQQQGSLALQNGGVGDQLNSLSTKVDSVVAYAAEKMLETDRACVLECAAEIMQEDSDNEEEICDRAAQILFDNQPDKVLTRAAEMFKEDRNNEEDIHDHAAQILLDTQHDKVLTHAAKMLKKEDSDNEYEIRDMAVQLYTEEPLKLVKPLIRSPDFYDCLDSSDEDVVIQLAKRIKRARKQR
mmetsp:Transcript_122621/g.216084  ORF Transcript_122621/g.216084 Transcript_122621/m.216084 type:complete len:334 (-) Transcript_122621:7-1008(-)